MTGWGRESASIWQGCKPDNQERQRLGRVNVENAIYIERVPASTRGCRPSLEPGSGREVGELKEDDNELNARQSRCDSDI